MDLNGNQNFGDGTQTPASSVINVDQQVPVTSAIDVSVMSLTGNTKNNGKKSLFFIVGIVVLILILLVVFLLSNGPEGVLNKYGQSFVDFDENKIVKVLHPNVIEMLQDEIEDNDDEDLKYNTVEGMFDEFFDEADDEDFEFIAFEIDKDFKNVEGEDLEDIADNLNDHFDIEKDDVKAARIYELEFEVEYDGESDKEDVEILVVKVGFNWYVFEDEFLIDEVLDLLVGSDVSSNSLKKSFVLYVDKILTAVQTQYIYDANGGVIAGAGYYVYDIANDLNLTSTGGFKGYVVVDASDVDNVYYNLSIYNDKYQLLNYNVSLYGMPTEDSKEIEKVDDVDIDLNASSASVVCHAIVPGSQYCYNRNGYLIY